MALVSLASVSYRYPTADHMVLRDIDLGLEEGEFVALVGPNGAGKSTLCYTVAGFIPHFFKGDLSGKVEVAGVETRQSTLPDWVSVAGLVFQNPFSQISGAKYTVFEEVAFGLENRGVPRAEMRNRVEEALEVVGIAGLAQRSPYSLSGGQQQRVALASMLVMRPRVLVLDEPTSQLDPIGSREVLSAVRGLAGQGMTVLIAEHKVEWIAAYADRVVALHEGAILAQGKPGVVLTDPRLGELGFGLSRYTSAARAAQRDGLWPAERRLPVTLDEAVAGFQRILRRDG
jgi:energy-coupling factor transporter ATP-binding protein EcfA2